MQSSHLIHANYEQVINKPKVFNDKGEVVGYYQYGADSCDTLIVKFNEEVFYKQREIIIQTERFNNLLYVMKIPFIKT